MNKSTRLVSASLSLLICLFVISGCTANAVTQKSTDENPYIKIDDTVFLGNYEQDNNSENGPEKIKWRVIAIEDTKALLISEKCLDCRQFNAEVTTITWEKCSLRSWLNDTFLKTAFSSEEQTAIILATIENQYNLQYSTYGGNDTQDKVFLLSHSEALKYFADDSARLATVTEYAKEKEGVNIIYGNEKYSSMWWLRSPGGNSDTAEYVSCSGFVNSSGCLVSSSGENGMAIRPALYIDLTSDVFAGMIASGINVNSEIYGDMKYLEQTTSLEDMKNISDLDEWAKLSPVDRAAYFILTNDISVEGFPIESINQYTEEHSFDESIALFGVGNIGVILYDASLHKGLEAAKLASAKYYYSVLPSGEIESTYEAWVEQMKNGKGNGDSTGYQYINSGISRQTGKDALTGKNIIFTNISIERVVTQVVSYSDGTATGTLGEIIDPEYTVQLIEVPIRLENGSEVIFFMIGNEIDGEASPDTNYPY